MIFQGHSPSEILGRKWRVGVWVSQSLLMPEQVKGIFASFYQSTWHFSLRNKNVYYELIITWENLWHVEAHNGHNDTFYTTTIVALFNSFLTKHNIPLWKLFTWRSVKETGQLITYPTPDPNPNLQWIIVSLKNGSILIPFTLRAPFNDSSTPTPSFHCVNIEWWPVRFPLLMPET